MAEQRRVAIEGEAEHNAGLMSALEKKIRTARARLEELERTATATVAVSNPEFATRLAGRIEELAKSGLTVAAAELALKRLGGWPEAPEPIDEFSTDRELARAALQLFILKYRARVDREAELERIRRMESLLEAYQQTAARLT